VLALLLQHPECAAEAERLQPDHLERHEHQAVLRAWKTAGTLERLWDVLDPSLHEEVSGLLSLPIPPAGEAQRRSEFVECLHRLELRRLRRLKAQQRKVLMEPGVDPSTVARLSYRMVHGELQETENEDPDAVTQAEILRRGLEIDHQIFALYHRRDDVPSEIPGWQGEVHDGRTN
jgi:hypothetical protein